jgi:predicted nuclease of predicted toxin-antitoxin system
MRFLVDAQLPPALARWLEAQGHRAQHVADLDMTASSDSVIWQWAISNQATILTKDEDFAQRRHLSDEDLPQIVWLRVGNTRKLALLQWFAALEPQIVEALLRGERLVEVD